MEFGWYQCDSKKIIINPLSINHVKIKVERSGGIAGLTLSDQIETNQLPPFVAKIVHEIIKNPHTNSLHLKSVPPGSADYTTYKITIEHGTKKRIVECNQFNLRDDLRNLVNYVKRNSKKQ
jgi:hypothetical protein